MLISLKIKNIVLIEECEINFASGLCVLTGETGAGKSILLDSLGLTLGARAETRLIRHNKEQASVNATFDISKNENAQSILKELGIDTDNELIIRRIITSDGKTKCFINDVAVSVNALKLLADNLIEIHGQHDGRGLLDSSTHKKILDLHGGLQILGGKVAEKYEIWQNSANKLKTEQEALENAAKEKDYLLHIQKELSAFAPQKLEEEALAEERTNIMQSEKLAQTLQDAITELNTGKGAVSMLQSAGRTLARSVFSQKFTAAIEALERATTELGEAEQIIEVALRNSEYDEQKLERTEERLFALRALARKYNVTADELPDLLAATNEKLANLSEGQNQIANLQKEVAKAKSEYEKFAQELSSKRYDSAQVLQNAVAGELEALKMGATKFVVFIEKLAEDKWNASGFDNIQFQAATNKGASLSPLHKIASGGELSRFMLAMKVALANEKSTPSLIFDEIDTGTGGAVADAIGKRLAKLGQTHQVLVITHLPQVAAQGSHHLKVSKQELDNQTFTSVAPLSSKDRKEELARMLAGAEVTKEARQAAEKLLSEIL